MQRKIIPIIASAFVFVLGTGIVQASDKCNVPMNEWQPREALQQVLENQNWKVERIKTDDGCYEVYATDPDGRRVEAKFDPRSFEMIKWKRKD